MSERGNFLRAAIVSAVLFGAGTAFLIYVVGSYAWGVFVAEPVLLGFLASSLLAIGKPERLAMCFGAAMLAGAIVALGAIVLGIEGAICILMALPLAAPLVFLGAFLGHILFHRGRRHPSPSATAMLVTALVAAAGVFEARIERVPEVHVVEDSILVHATAAETWSAVLGLSDVAPSHDVLFRAGIACPQRTRIVEPGVGGRRVCTMSTGLLMERIDGWQPGRRLSWRALSTPPPMRELNPFHDVDAPHLHGFYRNVRGEFAIEPAGPGLTRLTRRTWYSHDLYPAIYWTMWCDMGASKIQRFVLEEVRRAAETKRA